MTIRLASLMLIFLWAAVGCNSLRSIEPFQGTARSDMDGLDAAADAAADHGTTDVNLGDVSCEPRDECETRRDCPGLADCVCGACGTAEWLFLTVGLEGVAPGTEAVVRTGAIEFTNSAAPTEFEVTWTEDNTSRNDAPGITGDFQVDDVGRVTLNLGSAHDGWLSASESLIVAANTSRTEQTYLIRRGNVLTREDSFGVHGFSITADGSSFGRFSGTLRYDDRRVSFPESANLGGNAWAPDDATIDENDTLSWNSTDRSLEGYPAAGGGHLLVLLRGADGSPSGGGIAQRQPGNTSINAVELLNGTYGVAFLMTDRSEIQEDPADPAEPWALSTVGELEFDGAGGVIGGTLTSYPSGTVSTVLPGSTYARTPTAGSLDVEILDDAGARRCYFVGPKSRDELPTPEFLGTTRGLGCTIASQRQPAILFGVRHRD